MEQITTVQVTAIIHCKRGRLNRRIRNVMSLMKVLDRPAVTHHMPGESPSVTKRILQQHLASAAGLPVCPVIGAHHGLNSCFLHQRLECRQIGFLQILLADNCIKAVADILGTAVYCEVLCAGCCLQIIFIMSLQTLHKTNTESGGQVRVLTKSFVSAAPSGITENIDIGRPEGQTLVYVRVIIFLLHVEFRTALRGNCGCNLLQQVLIKGCRKSDGLRENRCHAGARNAVQRLIPPVISLDAESFDRRRPAQGLRNLLLQSHLRHKRFCPLAIFLNLLFVLCDVHCYNPPLLYCLG